MVPVTDLRKRLSVCPRNTLSHAKPSPTEPKRPALPLAASTGLWES